MGIEGGGGWEYRWGFVGWIRGVQEMGEWSVKYLGWMKMWRGLKVRWWIGVQWYRLWVSGGKRRLFRKRIGRRGQGTRL